MAEDEQFTKVLMVAEKPSVAKLLAEHLSGGRMRTRRGQSRANQIFEFIKYFGPAQQKCKLMVTSVVGHIYGLNFEVRAGSQFLSTDHRWEVEFSQYSVSFYSINQNLPLHKVNDTIPAFYMNH